MTTRLIRVCTSPVAFVILLAGVARAGDWPQWRGPRGDSTSDERGLPLEWSEKAGIAWKAELPEWGTSTPAISGDAIFVTTHIDNERLVLIKLSKRTGKVEWTREVGSGAVDRMELRKKDDTERKQQKFHKLHNMASPSPITDGERVIVHFGNGNLAAYNFAGDRLWQRNLQDDHGTFTIWWGHANSPVLFETLVISVSMQDSLVGVTKEPVESYLVAHDKRTGDLRWKTPRMTNAKLEECDSYVTPVFVESAGRTEMIVMGGDEVDAYDPATGKKLWGLPGLAKSRVITGPTVWRDRVFVTQGMRGPLRAVKVGGSGELSDDRAVAWKLDKGTPDSCCPVVAANLLFLITDDGIAQCFDALSGEAKWRERLVGDYKASPLAADGRVYFLNTRGTCTVVAAAAKFEKLAENQLDDETIASPAVSDGRIYVRGRKSLYCIAP